MIVRGIPYRIWEKVIRLITGFFFVATIISPFLGIILYIFEADFDFLLVKKNSFKKEKIVNTNSSKKEITSTSLLDTKHSPFVPIPVIEEHLTFLYHNDRPDITNNQERYISISSSENTLLTKENEVIYLECSDQDNVKFTKEETPYSITPISVKDEVLLLNFEVKYRNKENQEIYTCKHMIPLAKKPKSLSKLDKSNQLILNTIKSAKFYKPDKLISLMGGKEFAHCKDLPRLYFGSNDQNQMLTVKKQDRLTFEDGNWVKNASKTTDKPLFLITKIESEQITGTFWGSNGFHQKKLIIPLDKDKTSNIHNFTFDTIYKRNNETVICKFEGRTYILRPNDWLSKKHTSWNKVKTISEFNDLMDYKSSNEIIIFDHLKKNGDTEIFIGYIFDATRSNYKKLQIPLKKKATLRYSK